LQGDKKYVNPRVVPEGISEFLKAEMADSKNIESEPILSFRYLNKQLKDEENDLEEG